MTYSKVDGWYCCLAPAEKTITDGLYVGFLMGLGYITKEAYEGLWSIPPMLSRLKRRETYTIIFNFTETTITDIEGNVIEVLAYDFLIWTDIAVFMATEAAGCPGGCKERDFT